MSQELRLLVPAVLCGSIIGKGGATIRSFSEDSKAQIGLGPMVSPPSPTPSLSGRPVGSVPLPLFCSWCATAVAQ